MSQSTPTREVARRVFASEFNDAGYTFTESDASRAQPLLSGKRRRAETTLV